MQQYVSWIQQKRIIVAFGIILLGIAATIGIVSTQPPQTEPAVTFTNDLQDTSGSSTLEDVVFEPEAPTAAPVNKVIVYISGAIRAPDVYALPEDARVKDLVLAANGFTEDADFERINLAERLSDAQHVHVPRIGEQAAASTEERSSPDVSQELININTASATDLDELDGIGQSLAERIIEYRTANGPFASVDDLQQVKGIGSALFAKISAYITVGS
jgi:competence protein ComEA